MPTRIKIQDKGNIFFTADPHFGHYNIIKYCKRPFTTAEEMDETLITNWNNKIPEDGTVFVVGDVFFSNVEYALSVMNRLNGTKHLITGNHDGVIFKSHDLKSKFSTISDITEVNVHDEEVFGRFSNFVICHYPMRTWNGSHHGAFNLYGHVHGTLPPEGLQLDVGMDTNNYTPYSYSDVLIKIWDNMTSQTEETPVESS